MRTGLIAGMLVLAACASAEPETLVPAAPEEPPKIQWDNTGDGGFFYHLIWGDCEFLDHGFGRNNAWGRWRLPLAEVVAGDIVSDGHEGFEIRYTCKDGSACIQSGELDETPERIEAHTIPFGTQERAAEWLADAAALKQACGVSG